MKKLMAVVLTGLIGVGGISLAGCKKDAAKPAPAAGDAAKSAAGDAAKMTDGAAKDATATPAK